MSQKQTDDTLWLVLIGASLASKEIREEAMKNLKESEAPPLVRELWAAMRSSDGEGVRMAVGKWGVESERGETVIKAVSRAVQQRALAEFCRQAITHVNFSQGLNADQILDVLHGLASKIRAKQAAIEKTD